MEVKQGTRLIVEQGIYSVTAFLINVVLARTLLIPDYAVFVLAMSIIYVFLTLQKGLITTPLLINHQYQKNNNSSLEISANVHFYYFIGFVLFLSLVISYDIAPNNKDKVIIFSLIYMITISGYLRREYTRAVLIAKQSIRKLLINGLLTNLILISGLLLLLVSHKVNIYYALLLIGLGSLFPSFLVTNVSRKKNKSLKSNALTDFKSNLIIGKWILLTGITVSIAAWIYPWSLKWFDTLESVAAFGVCMVLANLPGPIMQGAYSYLLPMLSRYASDLKIKHITKTVVYSSAGLLIMYIAWMMILVFFGAEILGILFTEKYQSYNDILLIIVLSNIISAATIPVNAAMEAMKQPKYVAWSQLLGVLTTISVGIYLVIHMGLRGAALGLLLAAIVTAIFRLNSFLRITKRRLV